MPARRDTKAAFRWIVGVFRRREVPFQVSGGLAARAYGSRRPLADIDLEVPEARMAEVAAETKPFVTFGPARFTDEHWDLSLMTLRRDGQDIDVSGAESVRMRDAKTGEWAAMPADLGNGAEADILGLRVPVTAKAHLVAYKRKLGRPVDRADVAALEKRHRLVFRASDRAIYDAILSGKKKVETRAAGPKLGGIAAGDAVTLACGGETAELRVKRATRFPSVASMLQAYRVKDVAPDLSTAAELEAMYRGFPGYEEKLAKHGIIALEFER